MRRVLLRHRFAAGIFRHRSEPAPRRPRFQHAELPFSPQCCRVSIRAGRTRRPRTLQRRPLHPTSLVSLRDGSSFRHLGLREEKFSGFRSVWQHRPRRAGEDRFGNYSDDTRPAQMSVIGDGACLTFIAQGHASTARSTGASVPSPASTSGLPRGPWAIAVGERHCEPILGRRLAC